MEDQICYYRMKNSFDKTIFPKKIHFEYKFILIVYIYIYIYIYKYDKHDINILN